MGSVAYKLALVSAGLADITFTLTPKNEWDVAAGAALVSSAKGFLATLNGSPFRANNRDPLLSGLIASGPNLRDGLLKLLEPYLQSAASPRAENSRAVHASAACSCDTSLLPGPPPRTLAPTARDSIAARCGCRDRERRRVYRRQLLDRLRLK